MDVLGTVPIRFHFRGEFINDGKKLHYCGGREAMSYIDRDKISLPELVGHLEDHSSVLKGTLLHWLFPGKELMDGLRVLADDQVCQEMADSIVEGGVAEIFVEDPHVEEILDDNDGVDELEDRIISEEERQIMDVKDFYSSQRRNVVVKGSNKKGPGRKKEKEKQFVGASGEAVDIDDSSDSDYIPGDSCASDDDEEAAEIEKKFKEFKKKLRRGQVANLDDVVLQGSTGMAAGFEDVGDDGEETPYVDSSDDEESVEEIDSDGQLKRKNSKYPRFNKKAVVPRFALGVKFSCKKEFKDAIIKYGLTEKKCIKFIKDEASRVRAKCDWVGCPWFCLLSKNSRTDSWQIASFFDDHTCPPRRDNRLVTARRIAAKYEKFIIANPTWNIVSMKTTVQEEMFADVSTSKLKRVKAIVMQKALDATKGQYGMLYDYQLELLRSNPGSTVIVTKVPNMDPPVFQRMYICLNACKKGFMAGCRKVIGLDGCFFKGATNGELLCALGRDANNQMYPIAWAVVEKETNDSWEWFCDLLCRDICVGDGKDWVFISDQQKGILAAVDKWAPEAEHRNCARHIYANWKKHFRNKEWQKKFWKCAKAPCLTLFNRARAELAQETREGAQAILNTHPQHWSRAWFRLGSYCDSVDNNICESFNKWIIEARFFPIITMLETIRRKVMVRIQENRCKSDRWTGRICPNILKKMNAYINESAFCHAISNGNDKFEVKHHENRFTVNLETKECSCRYWQLSGLPCPHAISCIFFKTNTVENYIACCYSVAQFKETYAHCLEPVEGMESWPVSDRPKLQAPGYVRMPGRPRKERTREPTEKPKATKISRVGTVVRCRRCKGIGHNISTCEKREAGASSSATPAGAPSVTVGSRSACPQSLVPLSNTQESTNGSRKKKSGPSSREVSINVSDKSTPATKKARTPDNTFKNTSAASRVTTSPGGSATMNVRAHGPNSRASVTINITNGQASASVSAYEPRKKQPPKRAMPGPILMLPPWDSAKL